MPSTRSSAREKRTKEFREKKESKEYKEYKEKYTSELQKQGKTHLIISMLITTMTFVAGFTLPNDNKEDDGNTILTKKIAFIVFFCDRYWLLLKK